MLLKYSLNSYKIDLSEYPDLPELVMVSSLRSLCHSKFQAYNENINLYNKKLRKRIRSMSELVYVKNSAKNKYKFIDGF